MTEGGFAESESPVVLASVAPEMVEMVGSFDGDSSGNFWDDGAAAPALDSLRQLLETILSCFGRRCSEYLTVVSIYLSSFESSSNNSQY